MIYIKYIMNNILYFLMNKLSEKLKRFFMHSKINIHVINIFFTNIRINVYLYLRTKKKMIDFIRIIYLKNDLKIHKNLQT